MTRPLYILGTGGFGRETADIVFALNRAANSSVGWHLAGFYDDGPSERNLARVRALGVPFLGALPTSPPVDGAGLIVAIGSPEVRARICTRISGAGWAFPSLIHPTSHIGSDFTAGEGLVVCGGVQVTTNVSLGAHVHLNAHVTIGHDADLRSFVSVNPSATISGEVSINERTLIGAGAVVLQNLTIGEGSTVGAAACVVNDVSGGAVVKGVPAR